MTLCDYCYKKGMSLEQYEILQQNIKNTALAIIQNVKNMYKTDTGVYYPINDILAHNTDETMKQFIIIELKRQGMEFYDNNKLWRL